MVDVSRSEGEASNKVREIAVAAATFKSDELKCQEMRKEKW